MAGSSWDQRVADGEGIAPELQFEELPPPVKPDPPPPPIFPKAPEIISVSAAKDTYPPLSGIDELPSVLARPDLPPELQLREIPLSTPRNLKKAPLPTEGSPTLTLPPEELPMMILSSEGSPLLMLPSESWARTPKPTPLLAETDPEPGVIYVVPFIFTMVPADVQDRIFDQIVDTLNERNARSQLKFVIFKSKLDDSSRKWLEARKHINGEVYGYIEESGCCSTELRTRVRLNYYRAHQIDSTLKYEGSFRAFFDHDNSTLAEERHKLSDQVVNALVSELAKALQP